MRHATVIYSFRNIVMRRSAEGPYVSLQSGKMAAGMRLSEDAAQLLANYLMVNRAFFAGHENGLTRTRRFHESVIKYLEQKCQGALLGKSTVSQLIAHAGCMADWHT